MKTSPHCIDCFKRQIDYCVRLASSSDIRQAQIRQHAEKLLDGFDFSLPPPVNAMPIYQTISAVSNNPDPFKKLKEKSTKHTLSLRDQVLLSIQSSSDPLYSAALYALAGNIIDYGSQQNFDLSETLEKALTKQPAINDFDKLRSELRTCKSLLFLGDNCGEIIFDGLLIEQISRPTIVALKEGPIINDATVGDGYKSGLDKICQVISNGTSCPGTPLNNCSDKFKKLFNEADVIISKGQGNFETLSEVDRTVYFLLTVKCDVVAEHIKEIANCNEIIAIGDSVILKKH